MNSIGPSTKYLQQVRQVVAQSVDIFSTEICNLVGDYVADYRLAMRPLIFDAHGQIANPLVRQIIKLALASSDCDPEIKNKILGNMMDYDFSTRIYQKALQAISFEIAGTMNLDDTNLEGIVFRSWNLNGMTALRSVLNGVSFISGSMDHANFSDARLVRTLFKNISMDSVTALRVTYDIVSYEAANVENMTTDEPALSRYYSVSARLISSRPRKNCNSLNTTISTEFPLKRTVAVRLPEVAPKPTGCLIL